MSQIPDYVWQDKPLKWWMLIANSGILLAGAHIAYEVIRDALTHAHTISIGWLVLGVLLVLLQLLITVPPLLWKWRSVRIDYSSGTVEFRGVPLLHAPWRGYGWRLHKVNASDLLWVRSELGSELRFVEVRFRGGRLWFVARRSPELAECCRRLDELCSGRPPQASRVDTATFIAIALAGVVAAFLIAWFL